MRGAFVSLAFGLIWLAWNDPDERTWSLWKNTFYLAVGTAILAVPAGVVAAIVIHRTDAWGRNAAWFALIALLFVPLYLQAAGWDAWFGRQTWLWQTSHAHANRLLAAIWIHAVAAVPWVAMIVGAALMQVTPELEESACLDMPVTEVLVRVTLPLCWPAILLSCWWVFIMTTAEMTVTDLYQVRTYAEEVYTTIPLLEVGTIGELAIATAPRATWVMVGWVSLSLFLIGSVARHDFPLAGRARLRLGLGPWRILATLAILTITLTITAVPLINLCCDAGSYVEQLSPLAPRRWSAGKFIELLSQSPWRFRREFAWTAIIGASAATVAMVFAIPLAWMARRKSLGAALTLLTTTLVATIPGPILALMMISWLNREDSAFCVWLYDRTILLPVLAGAVRALPVAVMVTWWGIRTVPTELADMALLDGLNFFGRIRHIVWPSRRELLIAAWCAAFAFAAGDLAATLLVTPPGVSTLSIRVFGLLHAGVDDQVAAICLVNVVVCIVLAMIAKQFFQTTED